MPRPLSPYRPETEHEAHHPRRDAVGRGGSPLLDHTASDRFSFGANFNLVRTELGRVANDNAFATPLQLVALPPVQPKIDPATGETLWMWRMRDNPRWAASTRQNYGKGVAYGEVDGRGRILVITPGYYMAALDAEKWLDD